MNMRFVYVLEDDAKFQKEICEVIIGIDPKIQIRLFRKLEDFATWIKSVTEKGLEVIATGGETPTFVPQNPVTQEQHQIAAVISKVEFLGQKQLPLLKKTRNFFIQQKICTQEDPTAFVLTTFDEPHFNIKNLENGILNNVILKPFDKLILAQHLTFAIDGRHPPSKYSIANQKTTAVVEMLKEVNLEAISEVGFVSRSNRMLDKRNSVTKYYGQAFSTDTKFSLMAAMISCKQDTINPSEYICGFYYFGLSPSQVSVFRKNIRPKQTDFEYKWQLESSTLQTEANIVLVDEADSSAHEVKEVLQKKFKACQIMHYHSYAEFLMDLDPKLAEQQNAGPALKALPSDKEVTFVFDHTGLILKNFETPKNEAVMLFNTKEIDMKTLTWWQGALGGEMLNKWKEWIKTPKDEIFVISAGGAKFYIKPKTFNHDKATNSFKVIFSELAVPERMAYLANNSKLPKVIDALIVSHRFIQSEDSEKWLKIKESIKQRGTKLPLLLVLASKDYSDSEMRTFGTFVTDIFYRPLDRVYFSLKMKMFLSQLEEESEKLIYPTLTRKEKVSTANPVQISEISEAGLVMQYYRAINHGSFREFILWGPMETKAPRLVATCNFAEESSQKGIFNNHFVFFGITDHFLKSIRIWIRDNYILSKEQGG